jgi:hypothetical protein
MLAPTRLSAAASRSKLQKPVGSACTTGLLIGQETEPWHESERRKHCEVHRTRDLVPATKVLGQGLTLEENCQPQLRAYRKRQCKKPGYHSTTGEMNVGKTPKYVACREKDCGSHYWHFRQFRPALSDAWNEKRYPEYAQHESSAKHDCEVYEPGTNGF